MDRRAWITDVLVVVFVAAVIFYTVTRFEWNETSADWRARVLIRAYDDAQDRAPAAAEPAQPVVIDDTV